MSHQNPIDSADANSSRKRSVSLPFWLAVVTWALLLVAFIATSGLSGFFVWFLLAGFFIAGTALYAWISRRPSWLHLGGVRARRQFFLIGAGAVVVGMVGTAIAAPMLRDTQPADTLSTSTPTMSETGSATEKPVLQEECFDEEETTVDEGTELVCTRDANGNLVWLDRESSQRVTAKRAEASAEASRLAEMEKQEASASAEAQRVADDQRKAEELAAAEAQRLAEEAAAAAEAQRLAEEAAAAAEAQRLAEEQMQVPDPVPLDDDVYYANCSEAEAAGVAPLQRGDPGYASHLDGDNDGKACGSDK